MDLDATCPNDQLPLFARLRSDEKCLNAKQQRLVVEALLNLWL